MTPIDVSFSILTAFLPLLFPLLCVAFCKLLPFCCRSFTTHCCLPVDSTTQTVFFFENSLREKKAKKHRCIWQQSEGRQKASYQKHICFFQSQLLLLAFSPVSSFWQTFALALAFSLIGLCALITIRACQSYT